MFTRWQYMVVVNSVRRVGGLTMPIGKKRKTHSSSSGNESHRSSSQDNNNAHSAPSSPVHLSQEGTPFTHNFGEQLNRVEELLQRLLHRKQAAVKKTNAPQVLLHSPPPTASEHGDKKSSKSDLDFSSRPSSVSNNEPSMASTELPSAYNDTQRCLVALLPCQYDANVILESSSGRLILDGVCKASLDMYINRDGQSYALDMAAVAQAQPMVVANTLIYLAICMSNLPPEFETSQLSGVWSLEATMQVYVKTVMTLVMGSDQHMMTLHGLEALLLLGIYHMSQASLRQAWLLIRRGLSLAHVMGIHRIITEDVSPSNPACPRAKAIWWSLVDLDQYLGLHLRLPFGADAYPVPDDADAYLVHRSRINKLSRQIAELTHTASPQEYGSVLALDEALERAMKEMHREFWEVPDLSTMTQSPECHAVLHRLMAHLWHFGLKIFLHVPYLLQAGEQSRYEYSRVTALQASRSVVMRWFALRRANMTQAFFRLGELGVYMAGVTLMLDILIAFAECKSTGEVKREKEGDFALVGRLIGEMEALAQRSRREKMAERIAAVLRKMAAVLDRKRRGGDKIWLVMPFFGTVHVEYNKNQDGFSIVQNLRRPKVLLGEEGEGAEQKGDWDHVVFDGLEDRDVLGNWVF